MDNFFLGEERTDSAQNRPNSTEKCRPILLFLIHPIPQLLPRLEMRDELAIQADGLAGLGISAYAGGAVVEGEAAETANLDAVASSQRLCHLLEHGLDGQLDILRRKHPLLGDDTLDQLRLGHGFPFVFKRLDDSGCGRL